MESLIVPPFLQLVLEKLASYAPQKIGNLWYHADNLEKLKGTLADLRAILEHAEVKQVADINVRTWLSELRRTVLRAEDLLDEIPYSEGSSMKLELLRTQRADRAREMLVELENIKKDGYKLNLREHKKRDHGRRETSSFIVEYEVYGREEDKENIVKLLLLTEANQGRGVSCVAIIGLGGLGKTTLAQLVFNYQRVTQHFDVKIWVFVSDHFDAKTILMAVIESVSEKKSRHSTMEGLHSEVWGLLHKKRYLIVLDDVWTDDQGEWDKLIPLFRGGVDGSKIMITTRSERVALMMNSLTFPYFLKGLSEDACWSLFMQRAFQPGKEEKHPDLLPIGRDCQKMWRSGISCKNIGKSHAPQKREKGVVGCPRQ